MKDVLSDTPEERELVAQFMDNLNRFLAIIEFEDGITLSAISMVLLIINESCLGVKKNKPLRSSVKLAIQ